MLHTGFTDLTAVNDYRDVLTYDKESWVNLLRACMTTVCGLSGGGLWYISAAHTEEDIIQPLIYLQKFLNNYSPDKYE